MGINFSDYLDAKFCLDARCLNKDVYQTLLSSLSEKGQVRWLDLGTGTGAMLKHLLESDLKNAFEITGLDIEGELLDIARNQLSGFLQTRNYRLREHEGRLIAQNGNQEIWLDFVCCPLQDLTPRSAPPECDLITAHAFMDIVPLQSSAELISDWLAVGGMFYSTINYDGETTFFPAYENQAFENQLLAVYYESMEARRTNGHKTGGAKAGRRLYQALENNGFEILAYGSSDWNLTPIRGAYRDNDQTCLLALLDMIYTEGTRQTSLDQLELKGWQENRSNLVHRQKLGTIVHQLDLLAIRRD